GRRPGDPAADHHEGGISVRPESREIDAGLHLVDLQILDRHAVPVGRVDDADLQDTPGGPELVAILVGTPALAERFPSPLARWLGATYARLHDDDHVTALRIPFERVRNLNSRVDLGITRAELGIGRLDG